MFKEYQTKGTARTTGPIEESSDVSIIRSHATEWIQELPQNLTPILATDDTRTWHNFNRTQNKGGLRCSKPPDSTSMTSADTAYILQQMIFVPSMRIPGLRNPTDGNKHSRNK